ncbi:hypothetical protein SpCBS45565_g02126 [Spizellomyces sp. 'palustris']|nr:hypothetical protein SpCBS45565_g02126 [Spizellomyces sp. 'palustris']
MRKTGIGSQQDSSDPFGAFDIDEADLEPLYHQDRLCCPQCRRNHKVFCPRCGIPLGHRPPHVKLPISVDIYRDPRETEGKSTSAHARIIAPNSVTVKVENMVKAPDTSSITKYPDPQRCLLLFPSEDALPLDDIKPGSFDKLIVLDGTWKQGKAMAGAIAGQNFQKVSIRSRRTLFWRYQPFGESYLSTIEAVYWFFRDFHDAYSRDPYDGRYDNLLFYFKLQWGLIQGIYSRNPQKQFTSRKLDGASYIRGRARLQNNASPPDTEETQI